MSGTRGRPGPTENVDPWVVAAAVAVTDAQTPASTGTKSRAVRQSRQMAENEHGPGAVPLPPATTFWPAPEHAVSAGTLRAGGDSAS